MVMTRASLVQLGTMALVCSLGAAPARAQDTRAEVLSQERTAKAEEAAASPERGPGLLQRSVRWAMTELERSGGTGDGFYPKVGGLIPGSGWVSLGPGYRHHVFGDAAVWDTSAVISLRRYSMVQTQIQWPKLLSEHLSIGGQIKYKDFTQINYFGIGPSTSKSAQTDFRLKNVDIVGSATAHPRAWLSVGGHVGYISGLDVRTGLSSIFPSTDQRFDETTAPGLTVQPRYHHADVFAEADSRDVPGYPTNGGLYRVDVATFHDLDGTRHSFRRVDVDATQYVPIFHKNWLVVLSGHVAVSRTGADNDVPFYLLPTLGGQSTLRGYSDYRFRDRNVALFSAEYRWPVFRMMDAALFVDAGTVASSASELWRERPKHDYGFGVRLHSTTSSLISIDVAKGREGTRVTVSLSGSLGGGSRNVIPYLP
jgi:hypothetical protein